MICRASYWNSQEEQGLLTASIVSARRLVEKDLPACRLLRARPREQVMPTAMQNRPGASSERYCLIEGKQEASKVKVTWGWASKQGR